MSELGGGTLYARNQDLLSVDMDGDLVMMNIATGNYIGVDGIGPRIWELLEAPRSFEELADAICAEYEVDRETASADLQTFLSLLAEHGMLAQA